MNDKSTTGLRRAFELVQPSFLSGYTLPDWIRLLRSNSWAVDAKYLPRALMATFGALATSAIKPFEPRVELDAEAQEIWSRPVFILGLARSGTTHLFNILAETGAFGFPTRLDCYNPHTFLLLRGMGVQHLLAKVPSKARTMDNVQTGWLSPEEDQIAMRILVDTSFVAEPFSRHRDMLTACRFPYGNSPAARERFGKALRQFSEKLVHLHRRPLLFKSPSHTCAIPEILSVFPDARFIMILRNPFDQYASRLAMLRNPRRGFFFLQSPQVVEEDEILESIRAILMRYLQDRGAIAHSKLVEIRYEKLVADPVSALQEVHSRFGLEARHIARMRKTADYVRNAHPEISDTLKDRLREIYRPCVDAGLFTDEDMA